MKVKINNLNWEIKEATQKEIKEMINKRAKNDLEEEAITGRYYGSTYLDEQIIWIDKDLPLDRKKRTLLHELGHAYIGCYITHLADTSYNEELVCDIISNSFDIIREIADKYFETNKA